MELHITIERANIEDAKEILDLQKLTYQSEAENYNDYTIPPLTQTLEEIEADFITLDNNHSGSRFGG